jgi:hypothetical protein
MSEIPMRNHCFQRTVSRELAKYKLDVVRLLYRSDGTSVAVNQQTIIHSSMEMGMLIIT